MKLLRFMALALIVVPSLALATSASYAQDRVDVSIDANAKGEPISPFIYGQFIEHLGRCIYGGIWSEMLQDRKFYDAPAMHPWELVGATEFKHDPDGKFVGKASPHWKSANADEIFGVEQSNIAFAISL